MQLVVVTSPNKTANEARLCMDMHKLGLSRLHLRKPGWSKSDAANFLSQLDASTLKSLVLHDWHDLAGRFSVKVVPG